MVNVGNATIQKLVSFFGCLEVIMMENNNNNELQEDTLLELIAGSFTTLRKLLVTRRSRLALSSQFFQHSTIR